MTTQVVAGLVEKRREVAGQVLQTEAELRKLRASLDHLDATIRLFDPDMEPKRIKAADRRSPPVLRDLHRHVLDMLRELGEPVTTRTLSRRLIERHGLDAKALNAVDKAVSAYLRRQDERLLERAGDGRPSRWRIRTEVE